MKNVTPISLISAAVFFLFAAVASVAAQQPAIPTMTAGEQAVRKLERAWLDAYEKRDAAAMDAIVAGDFLITFPDGSSQAKKEIMDQLKQAGGPAMKFRTEGVRSRSYTGDTVVILTGFVVSEWQQGGQTMTDRSRYTDTYIKTQGRWQVVASHLSGAGK